MMDAFDSKDRLMNVERPGFKSGSIIEYEILRYSESKVTEITKFTIWNNKDTKEPYSDLQNHFKMPIGAKFLLRYQILDKCG